MYNFIALCSGASVTSSSQIHSAIVLKKIGSGMHRVTQNLVGYWGDVSYSDARKNKVPECCSCLHLSDKELLEQHFDTSCHKNTPANTYTDSREVRDLSSSF
jgi:hypothetical protein